MKHTGTILLGAVLVLALYVGNVARWFDAEVVDTDSFVASATVALGTQESRDAMAELIVERLVDELPILVVVESSLSGLFSSLLGTPGLTPVVTLVSTNVHERVMTGDTSAVVIDIDQYRDVIVAPIEAFSPELAALVPEDWFVSVEILAADTLPDLSRQAGVASGMWVTSLFVAVAAIVALLARRHGAGTRRAAYIGGAFALSGALSILLIPLSRRIALASVDSASTETLVANMYDQLTRPLWLSGLVLIVVGAALFVTAIVVSAFASAPQGRPDST